MARATPAAGDGDSRVEAAPLTVAAVARSLGVAASTLRTWDRRYGLGPSGHQAGSHRRYTPEDVARLQTMRHLTLRGVAPADAARIATQTADSEGRSDSGAEDDGEEGSLVLDPLTLAAAAVEPDLRRVHRMLQRAIRETGVIATWNDLVQPAASMVDQGRHRVAERPGSDPHSVIQLGLMQAIRELATPTDPAPVRILTATADRMRAHVIAGGLAQQDVGALVVRAEHAPRDSELESWLPPGEVTVLAVVGTPPGAEEVVTAASERGDVEVFLLGGQTPAIWLRHVHRVRTAEAAVAEITAAVRE